MTIYAVGDIHGCPGMLRAVLDLILEDARMSGAGKPRVVCVGDLIDRGPDSKGVIDLLLSDWFSSSFDATVLRGNHEQMMLDAPESRDNTMLWLHNGGAETVESYGIVFGGDSVEKVVSNFMRIIPADHLRFFRNLPLSHEEEGLLFVHAGVDPRRALDDQLPSALLWTRDHRAMDQAGLGRRIVHGHTPTPFLGVDTRPGRICVDTGSGYSGGILSAAAIEDSGEVRTLSAGPARDGALDIAGPSLDKEPVRRRG